MCLQVCFCPCGGLLCGVVDGWPQNVTKKAQGGRWHSPTGDLKILDRAGIVRLLPNYLRVRERDQDARVPVPNWTRAVRRDAHLFKTTEVAIQQFSI